MLGTRHVDLYLVHTVSFNNLWWNDILGNHSLNANHAFLCICWTLLALNAAKTGNDIVLDSFTLLV